MDRRPAVSTVWPHPLGRSRIQCGESPERSQTGKIPVRISRRIYWYRICRSHGVAAFSRGGCEHAREWTAAWLARDRSLESDEAIAYELVHPVQSRYAYLSNPNRH